MTDDALPTVLLAEDEPMLRMAVAEVLEDAAYLVLQAADGVEGNGILNAATHVDLLISDIKMPRMNGYDLAAAALALRSPPQVLLMTGYSQEPLPDRLKEAAVQVLYKPFDLDMLVKMADQLIGRGPR